MGAFEFGNLFHSHQKVTMKFFLAFLALFAAASAQESCDLCKMGVDALGQYLMTEAEIAAVEEGLVDLVCSTLEEEEVQICAQGVYTWWPSVTEALFNYEAPLSPSVLGPEAAVP